MRIAVIGTGYVGLVTGACLADVGNHVVCIDTDAKKIETLERGHVPFFEPGLEAKANFNLEAKRLEYSTDISRVKGADVVFLAVGTPTTVAGHADITQLERAAASIAPFLGSDTIVVNKSTVPVGSAQAVDDILLDVIATGPVGDCSGPGTVSNPEFLAEGRALEDFMKPDRVVVGIAADRHADRVERTMRALYAPFIRSGAPILVMRRESAELAKYASNGMLAARISFINEVARICDQVEADVDEVRAAMGADRRIGHAFLYPGIGYGGSCFAKDVRALASQARQAGVEPHLFEAVERINNEMKNDYLIEKALAHYGTFGHGQNIAIWGLAFKPNTDDMREAPSLALIEGLLELGHDLHLSVFDPVANDTARVALEAHDIDLMAEEKSFRFAPSQYSALEGASALFICTEWNNFRGPDWKQMRQLMTTGPHGEPPTIFDGRNVLSAAEAHAHGFHWYGVGKP